MQFRVCLSAFLVVCVLTAQAQFKMAMNVHAPFYLSNDEDVQTIKTKVLLVPLEEENPNMVKSLSKNKSDLQWYRDQIAGKNEAIRHVVDSFWTFSSEKLYAPASKVAGLMKTGNYVMLQFGNITVHETVRTGSGMNHGPVGWHRTSGGIMTYNPATKKIVPFDRVTTLQIMVPKKTYGAIITNMPTDVPSKADVVYGIQQLQYVLTFVDAGNKIKDIEDDYKVNQTKLKEKTLLIDREDLDEKLTEQLIKTIYPHPFRVASTEEIDKAIVEKDSRYAFVKLVPMAGSKGVVASHYVCDAQSGKIYATIEKSSALTLVGKTFGTKFIKEKHVKEYAGL